MSLSRLRFAEFRWKHWAFGRCQQADHRRMVVICSNPFYLLYSLRVVNSFIFRRTEVTNRSKPSKRQTSNREKAYFACHPLFDDPASIIRENVSLGKLMPRNKYLIRLHHCDSQETADKELKSSMEQSTYSFGNECLLISILLVCKKEIKTC